jgi:transposase
MARLGRPLAPLSLGDEDRATLERWTARRTTAQALAQRARIVLMAANGVSNKCVAERERITPHTVSKWRRRFVEGGVDGLLDEPRPGAPRTITDEDVERVLTLTLEEKPSDATHWSTRSMAKRTGLSQSAISRIWRAFALQPHRSESFKLSADPLFIEKVRDIAQDPANQELARQATSLPAPLHPDQRLWLNQGTLVRPLTEKRRGVHRSTRGSRPSRRPRSKAVQ